MAVEEVEDGVEVGDGGDGSVADVGDPEVNGGVVTGFLGWLGHGGVRLTDVCGFGC